jgi:hypothetical protein
MADPTQKTALRELLVLSAYLVLSVVLTWPRCSICTRAPS